MKLSVGDRLGPYEILAPIGAGGMGEVYKACDTRLGRTVAVKTLKAGHGERFRREARAIASLNHPHVCTLHDVGEDYLVMEYLEGAPLRGPLPAVEAVRYALQICEALEAAHAKGIIHRDLKPANVLLTASGVKLLDFGLAVVVAAANADTATELTETGKVLGTTAYLSPEQAEGRSVDHRSDLFSLGVLLYQLLSGRRPFAHSTRAATIAALLRDPPPALPPEVPPALRAAVERCLEKDPARRYASAAELKTALLEGEPVPDETVLSIAVLPFANLGKEQDDYLADGIAHELIHALSRVEGLRIAARSAAFRFRGDYDVQEVGRRLGVRHVVEGAVQRAGGRLRITAELVQVSNGYVLWSARFDRERKELFDVQDEVCAAVVAALTERRDAGPSYAPVPRPTRSLAAYDAYLQGIHLLARLTPSDIRRGASLLEQATRLDDRFHLPLVGLSVYHSMLAVQGLERSKEALARAESLVLRALAIDERLPEAHRAQGLVRLFRWDWAGHEAANRRALALRPGFAPAQASLALATILRGDGEAGVSAAAQALALAPLEPAHGRLVAQALCFAGHYQRAVVQAEATIAIDPDYMPTYWWLATAQWLLGRQEEAVATIARKLPFGDCYGAGLHAAYIAQVGRVDEARGAAQDLEARWESGGVTGVALASAWAGLGETARALAWLETAFQEGCASLILLGTPWLASLRREPRFQELLRKVGLPAPPTDPLRTDGRR